MEWIYVALLLSLIFALLIVLIKKSRIVRMFAYVVGLILILPFFYLVVELTCFYLFGRTIVPEVGVFWGVIAPPSYYFKPLAAMEIEPDKFTYEGMFNCRYLGRYELNMELDSKVDMEHIPINVDFKLKYEISDIEGNVCASGIAKRGRQDSKCPSWPYVHFATFYVPTQIPRCAHVKIKIWAENSMAKFLQRTPCAQFVVMKVSDE